MISYSTIFRYEIHIQQIFSLEIGGWKLLIALGIIPEVFHMNEGHAALLVLECANNFMKERGTCLAEALAVTWVENLFTTHTAVAACFDHFNPALMNQFFGLCTRDEPGINCNDLMVVPERPERLRSFLPGRHRRTSTSEAFIVDSFKSRLKLRKSLIRTGSPVGNQMRLRSFEAARQGKTPTSEVKNFSL